MSCATSPALALDILYCDDSLLVLNKPAGLLSVPGRGEDKQDCLHRRVQTQFPDALVVHRLDMATSGLMLFARSKEVQRQLGDAFARREVHKRYQAVVNGILPCPIGQWTAIDLPIAVDWPNRPLRVIDKDGGKACLTRMQCTEHNAKSQTSKVLLEPVTGRSHQLRVHMQAIGHSILGDTLYATEQVRAQSPRLLLHANQIAFHHPQNGLLKEFHCPAEF